MIIEMQRRRRTGLGVEMLKPFDLGPSTGQPGFSLGDELVEFQRLQRHESLTVGRKLTAVRIGGEIREGTSTGTLA